MAITSNGVVCDCCGKLDEKPLMSYQNRDNFRLYDLHQSCVPKFIKELEGING